MTTKLTLPDCPRADIVDKNGKMPVVWQNFFRALFERVGRGNELSNTEIADIIAFPGLIPSRLASTDSARVLTSVDDLSVWISGTTARVTATSITGGKLQINILEAGIDHNLLKNLTAGDVHTQYFQLAGRGSGQIAKGGVNSGGNLTLTSTAHATKGKIFFGESSAYDEVNSRLGVGTIYPVKSLDVSGSALVTGSADFLLTGSSLPTMSGTVYGTGTLFVTELSLGNVIVIDGQETTVSGFTSETEMAVTPDIGVYGASAIRKKQNITGTGSTFSTTTVVGSGTTFLTDLIPGDLITVNEQERVVNVVSDDTHLTVTVAFTITAPGSVITRKRLLTGTANAIPSATVKGYGTLFTQQLTAGDIILLFGETRAVDTIISNTELTVVSAFSKTGPSTIWRNSPVATFRKQSGSSALVISWEGKVGIGTVDPRFALSFGTSLYDNSQKLSLYDDKGASVYGFGITANSLDIYSGGSLAINVKSDGKVGIGCTPLQAFQVGPNTSNSTSSPRAISMGGDYSNAPGENLKFRIYDDNAGNVVGMGCSAGQYDFNVPSGVDYVFYIDDVEVARISADSFTFPHPFGSMYVVSGTITCSVANAGEWYYIGTGLSGGTCSNVTFQNSKELKATVAGDYIVNWSATVQCATAGQNIMGGVMVNNTIQSSGASGADLAANTNGTLGGTCVVTLAANDVVRIGISNQTAVNDVVVNHANLTMAKL